MNNFFFNFIDNQNFYNNVALVQKNNKITYGELKSLCSKIESLITHRSLVFLVCRNCIESIASYLAIVRSGSVCMMIGEQNYSYLDELSKIYKPQFIVIPSKLNSKKYGSILGRFINYELNKTSHVQDYAINEDLVLMISTSGSTGSPKFVKLSYQNIKNNTESISKSLYIKNTDRAITTLPMNYSYGLSIINTHLSNGASVILNEYSIISEEFWDLFKTKKATTFGGVPYIFEMLKKLKFDQMDLPSLKYITQAGGKLSDELVIEFHNICKRNDVDFFVMYGQTEATARIACLPCEDLPKKVGSIGFEIPGGSLSIVDENNVTLTGPKIIGELVFKGDNVSLGYSEGYKDLKNRDKNNGILHTGDLAMRDLDGYYYIKGRNNRFLKVFGNRVNLDELETIIGNLGYECACTGVEDKINLFTTSFSNKKILLRNLMSHTGIHQSAFNIINMKLIPRSESGKVLYSKLV